MYRILITGSRDWPPGKIPVIAKALEDTIMELVNSGTIASEIVIVHGACPKGADAMSDWIAKYWSLNIERHPADWDTYGKAAGYIRNSKMVNLGAYKCLAFRYNKSKGTSNTIDLCEKAGIPVIIFDE